MIRTHLVKALYKKLLGPELAVDEEIESSPVIKYTVGILSTTFVPKEESSNNSGDISATDDPLYKVDKICKVKPTDVNEGENETDQIFSGISA